MKTDASGFPENVRRPGIPNPTMILSENPERVPQGLQDQAIVVNLAKAKL